MAQGMPGFPGMPCVFYCLSSDYMICSMVKMGAVTIAITEILIIFAVYHLSKFHKQFADFRGNII